MKCPFGPIWELGKVGLGTGHGKVERNCEDGDSWDRLENRDQRQICAASFAAKLNYVSLNIN